VLQHYLKQRFPECTIALAYEAGFGGFWLHDALEADGVRCEVLPPNRVTQQKDNRVKTDKIDARRLAKVLESEDCRSCDVPDQERREDRQISRTLIAVQKDLTRVQGVSSTSSCGITSMTCWGCRSGKRRPLPSFAS
jgi:transposase